VAQHQMLPGGRQPGETHTRGQQMSEEKGAAERNHHHLTTAASCTARCRREGAEGDLQRQRESGLTERS